MNKGIYILCLLSTLFAGTNTVNNENRIWDVRVHNVNNVEMCVSNFGKIGQDASGDVGCWWPTGSGQNYICGAGMWFGTRDSIASDSVDTLVTAGFIPYYGQSEFAPGLSGQDPDDDYVRVYFYPVDWPPPAYTFPMAPQYVRSHQDSWCCYNDSDAVYHTPGDTRPLGIEVYQTIYVWVNPLIEDILFVICEVKNVSADTLQDCYIGFCADCDIGSEMGTSANDRYGGIIDRWYVVDGESLWVDDIGYQWQQADEPGWASYPGVIGCDLVQAPPDLVAWCDKDGDGIPDQYECDSAWYMLNLPYDLWDVDNDLCPDWRDPSEWPQYGVTAMKQFTVDTEPTLDGERYRLLAGYDAYGYNPYDTLPTNPGDQRFLLSSGPFDFGPDSSVTIICAFMFADWFGLYETPDTAVVLIDQYAQEWCDMYWHLTIEEYLDNSISSFFSIIPNPAIDRTYVQFNMVQSGHVAVKVYNCAGQMVQCVYDQKRSAGQHSVVIHTNELSSGTYFAVLETEMNSTTQSFVVLR